MKQEIAMKYNRRIFPLYKGFGWDPLFYSAIIFLFLTEVKGISPAQVMYAEAIYSLFLLLLQIPATILIEKIGSRKALILGTIFATIQIIMMISTYENSLLTDLQVASQYFGIIFAILTLVQCFSVRYQDKIHNSFKNKTLAFISIPIFISFIITGIVANLNLNFTITIIIVMFTFFIHHFFRGPYWVLEDEYVTNFTTANIRAKILSTSNLIKNIGKIVISFLGGLLLEFYSTSTAYLIIGIVGLIIILLVLRYMKQRIGLKPEEYNKEDIVYEE